MTHGHARECWLVRAGSRLIVVKLRRGPARPDRLWRQLVATHLAARAGVPTPRILSWSPRSTVVGGSVLVTEYLSGTDGLDFVAGARNAHLLPLMSSLGRLLRRLHTVVSDRYSELTATPSGSRSWAHTVVSYLTQHEERLVRQGLVSEAWSRKVLAFAASAAAQVESSAYPALVHRELHLPNIVTRDGRAYGLLDFESARLWDPVSDLVKLRRWVFRDPSQEAAFFAGYGGMAAVGGEASARYRLCVVVESVSLAGYWWSRHELDRARTEIAVVNDILAGRQPDLTWAVA